MKFFTFKCDIEKTFLGDAGIPDRVTTCKQQLPYCADVPRKVIKTDAVFIWDEWPYTDTSMDVFTSRNHFRYKDANATEAHLMNIKDAQPTVVSKKLPPYDCSSAIQNFVHQSASDETYEMRCSLIRFFNQVVCNTNNSISKALDSLGEKESSITHYTR